jgi:hypothetical protein
MNMQHRPWLAPLVVLFASGCGGDVILQLPSDGGLQPTDSRADTRHDAFVTDSSQLLPDGQSCADLQAAASSQFNAVVSAASLSCNVDSDCVYAQGGCFGCCDFPIANKSSALTINDTSSQLCQQLTAEGCGIPQCAADCVAATLTCVAGTCTSTTHPDAGPETAPDGQTCTDLQSAAKSQYLATLAANQACAVDSDCATPTADTSCFGLFCQQPVSNVSGVASIDATATNLCQQLAAESCTYSGSTPPCIAMSTGPVACIAGVCGFGPADTGITDTGTQSQTCMELQAAARTAFGSIVDGNMSCTVDSDCTFTSGGCFDVCSESVTNVASSFVVTEAANVMCQILSAEGCAMPAGDVPCIVGATSVACQAGSCVGVY